MDYIYNLGYKLVDSKTIFSWIIYLLKSTITIPRIGINYSIRICAFIFNTLYTSVTSIINNITINSILLEIYNHSPDFAAIFAGLVVISIGSFVYIKLKYPFWNIQPVFHTYDFWRYYYSTPFIIRDFPMTTKFYDPVRIKTLDYLETSHELKTQIIDLLRCKYIATDRLLYTINESILDAFIKGNSETSLVSYSKCELDDKLNGFMCSRSIHLYFLENKSMNNKPIKWTAYYWDIICSDASTINTKNQDYTLSRRLIQTHEYNQRQNNPEVKVSLFKKEIHLCDGVVPLIKYKTYSYELRPIKLVKLPHHTHVHQIVKTNIHVLLDFLEGLAKQTPPTANLPSQFEFLGLSNVGVLFNWIVTNQLYCFCLQHRKHILGYYFFKNANIQYEDMTSASSDSDTLHFIASYNNSNSTDLFILGYMHSVKAILKQKKTFKMILFDDIAHNGLILPSWNSVNLKLVETEGAYYLYNMFFPKTLQSNKVFIL